MTSNEAGAARPAPEAVATRAVVLGALCIRAFLEHIGQEQPEEAEAERVRLLHWLNEEGLADAVTDAETPVFEAPVGELGDDRAVEAAWQIEALAVLLWALGQREAVPPYDEEADAEAILHLLPRVGEPTATFRVMAGLRPAAELEAERERARLWHWRARTQVLLDQGFDDPDVDLAAAVMRAGEQAVARGALPGLLEGDFVALGRPYHELPDDEFGMVASLAAVRHAALNWLCGHAQDWDLAGADT